MRSVLERGGYNATLSRLTSCLEERFTHHPYIYLGVSGTTLLHEVLKSQSRSSVILPAFICPFISAAAMAAGKKLTHIDADVQSQLPNAAQLEAYLEKQDTSDTCLVLDHSFGYPFPGIARLRKRFPELLIFEDFARAIGLSIDGQASGEHSDYVLLSMYKTIAGSRNGAVLLSKTPLEIPQYPPSPISVRERVATIAPLRSVFHFIQRHSGSEVVPSMPKSELPMWKPAYGSPSNLCIARFVAELQDLEGRTATRSSIAEELSDDLRAAGMECIRAIEGNRSAGHFVSLRVQGVRLRDQVLSELCKKGFPMGHTWSIVSSRFQGFHKTFPFGNTNSEYLANHMLHIRVRLFATREERRRLVKELKLITS